MVLQPVIIKPGFTSCRNEMKHVLVIAVLLSLQISAALQISLIRIFETRALHSAHVNACHLSTLADHELNELFCLVFSMLSIFQFSLHFLIGLLNNSSIWIEFNTKFRKGLLRPDVRFLLVYIVSHDKCLKGYRIDTAYKLNK